jgi:hypothetical protein
MIAEEPKLKHTVALLLLCAVFAAPGAVPVFARDGKPPLVAAIPAGPPVNPDDAADDARSAASPDSEEGGLTQEANVIGRFLGLPITRFQGTSQHPKTASVELRLRARDHNSCVKTTQAVNGYFLGKLRNHVTPPPRRAT